MYMFYLAKLQRLHSVRLQAIIREVRCRKPRALEAIRRWPHRHSPLVDEPGSDQQRVGDRSTRIIQSDSLQT